ncbi:hypothetical protein Tco_0814698 [Tanacetum coccineum]
MAESSSQNSSSPEITPKEEPVTLDKPESPNPFLPASQDDFTFDDITFTTNNEVALLYPSYPNQKYFKDVLDFISKCCLNEAFTRAPTQYKEYISEFWYTTKTLEGSKVWVSTPTGGVRGDIDVHVDSKAPKPSSQTKEVPQGKKSGAKSGLRRKQSSKLTSESKTEASIYKTGQSKKDTQSSSAKDKSPSHPSPPTPVVGEMHKEAHQAAGGPTSLGATSEEGAHPQLSSDEPIIVTNESEEEEANKGDTHDTSHDVPEDTSLLPPLSPKPAQIQELMGQVAELKNIQWELLAEFQAIPALVFTTVVENASTTTKDVSSAGQATDSPTEGEKNTKDADINLKDKLVDLLGKNVMTHYYTKKLLFDKYCDKMLKRKKSHKITNCKVITKKGPITLKIYREDGSNEVISNLKLELLKILQRQLFRSLEDWEVSSLQCMQRYRNQRRTLGKSFKGLQGGKNIALCQKQSPWEMLLLKLEVDIIKKTENQAKMTKLSMEWKRLCKIKAKVQKCQSQSQYRRISSQTGAGTEEYY